jgi:hypothetical protein
MVNTVDNHTDRPRPGVAFWVLALGGFPLAGVAVALLLAVPVGGSLATLASFAVYTGLVAAPLLALLPGLRRLDRADRIATAVLGGVLAAIASIPWLIASVVVVIVVACSNNSHCFS